jgi:beta-lactam-binding protein with PASTA domain
VMAPPVTKCVVPPLKGLSPTAGKAALKTANCGVGTATKKTSATVAKGQIIASSPAAGTTHNNKTKVNLTISSGPPKPPKAKCVVPPVIGLSTSAAKSALKTAHCSVGTATQKASATVAKGLVISSSPKAGTTHNSGTKVNLTISSG